MSGAGEAPPRPPVRMPAEWEEQDAILLAWPHPDTDWAPLLDRVEQTYLELLRAITRFETAVVVAPDINPVERALERGRIPRDRVRLLPVPTDDTWARDFGPVAVTEDDETVLLDFRFNGWGGKFDATRDDRITRRLADAGLFSAPVRSVDRVLEGGSVESDGRGTLLTTTQCLLNPNRNPGLDRAGLEAELTRWLGAERILWLEHGALQGDDTDSHVDTLARLAPEGTILHVVCDDPGDPHHESLAAMAAELAAMRTAAGTAYRLIPLPWPRALHDADGQRLPATYANYLVVNDGVLVPTYADPTDAAALQAIITAFPGREVVGVDCRVLLEQHGSLHCVTMQLPKGVLR